MKIEVGKKYEAANGDIAVIVFQLKNPLFNTEMKCPFFGYIETKNHQFSCNWSADGRTLSDVLNDENPHWRLIAEHTSASPQTPPNDADGEGGAQPSVATFLEAGVMLAMFVIATIFYVGA